MNCIVIPDRGKPFVEVQGVIYCGRAYGENEILRNMMPHMLVRGTRFHNKGAFARMLDEYALQYSIDTSSLSPFFMGWHGRSLPQYLPNLLAIIQESLECPAFLKSELEVEKGHFTAFIDNQEHNPSVRSGNEGARLLYKPGHPFYKSPKRVLLDRLGKLSPFDLQESWKLTGVPKSMQIVVVGPVDPDQVRSQAEELFSSFSWSRYVDVPQMVDCDTFTGLEMDAGKEECTVFIPERSNAVIWIGERMSITSTDDRYPALIAAKVILGGGTSSRLFDYVREELGLSYSVYSSLFNMHRIPGFLEIMAQTNFENVQETQEAIFQVLDELVEGGITQEELDLVKATLRGERAYSGSSYRGIAQEEIISMVSGVQNLRSTLEKKIARLTVQDVNGAIAAFIHPSQMKIVRAGTIT